jgi:hypothetical protein
MWEAIGGGVILAAAFSALVWLRLQVMRRSRPGPGDLDMSERARYYRDH